MVTSFLIYILSISVIFIPIDSTLPEHNLPFNGTLWENLYNVSGGSVFFLGQISIVFISGMVFGGISMIVAALTLDKFATIAVPFIFNYYIIYFAQRMHFEFLDLSKGLAPTSITKSQYLGVLVTQIIIFIFSYIIFYKASLRRTSNG